MKQLPIGVLLDSFRADFPAAMKKAGALGLQGIQVYATSGRMAPEEMTAGRQRDFLALAKDNSLTISALCGDLCHGFGNPAMNPGLIERSKRILDLAKKLETDVVTTHIGVVPESPAHPRYKVMQEACGELARYADGIGAFFAIETGPETSATLKAFLDSLGSRGLSVNLDPANLVMVTGDDPVQAVYTLKDYIVHTHAKDGRRLRAEDPEVVYGLRPANQPPQGGAAFAELPLGAGDVNWPAYIAALNDIGYAGFLTIEREVGNDPAADIAGAADFLRGLMRG